MQVEISDVVLLRTSGYNCATLMYWYSCKEFSYRDELGISVRFYRSDGETARSNSLNGR